MIELYDFRNPEEKEKDPIPIYFELNKCHYDCSKSNFNIEKTLEEYKFLGLSMTKEVQHSIKGIVHQFWIYNIFFVPHQKKHLL